MLRGHRDLKVYQLSYKLAMEIFHLTRGYEEVGKMLSGMMANPERFSPA